MNTIHLSIITILCISVAVLTIQQAHGVPYISPPAKYFNSDIVLIGKVISSTPFSPTYTKYEIQVEQYLKNPQSQDTITVIASGTNKTRSAMTADSIFDVGQRVFLYLKKDQGNNVVWWYSYPTESLCDPAPTAADMNSTYVKGAGLDYDQLHTGASESNSYLYAPNQPIIISYDAWNNQFTTKTFDVVFQVKNQTGQILFNDTKQVDLKPCIGHQIVNSTFIPKVAGTYDVDVIFDNSLTGTTVEIPSLAGTSSSISHASPLKQFKSGIKPEYVKCSPNLHLIIKAEDGSFACVTIGTGKNLAMRGWTTTFGTGISTNDYYTNCDTPYPQSDTGIAVLYMPVNSIGKICVQYHNLNNTPTGVGMRIFEANDLTQNASNVTAWTYDSTLEANVTKTIVYFIKTGNKTGFYGASLNCGGIPLAVGYSANSTITANNFPWVGKVFNCMAITYESHMEGTAGIGVRYIPYSYVGLK